MSSSLNQRFGDYTPGDQYSADPAIHAGTNHVSDADRAAASVQAATYSAINFGGAPAAVDQTRNIS
jgi:hypothetical protein